MTIINFQQVKVRATKKGKSPEGKYVIRSKTFSQTINPFNKNEDGTVKNYHEVFASVKEEAEEWKKEPIN